MVVMSGPMARSLTALKQIFGELWSKKWSLQVFLGGGYCFCVRREEGNLGRMRDGERTWWRITHRWLSSPPPPRPPATSTHTHARSSDQIKLKADGAGPGLRIVSDCHGALVVISHREGLPGQKKGMRKRQGGVWIRQRDALTEKRA